MFKTTLLAAAILASASASAAPRCPDAVTKAVTARFPNGKLGSCHPEHEDGRDQFEVIVALPSNHRAEVDVSPAGAILQIEERIPLAQVPAPSDDGLRWEAPRRQAERAEKQTSDGQPTSYELAFRNGRHTTEATFRQDGTFVEEE
jgi:uncharacterized membrane protein YkoI